MKIPLNSSSPIQESLQDRLEALDPEGQPDDIAENNLPGECPNYTSSVRQITASNIKKKRSIVVVADFLLRGTEGPVY